MSRNILYLCSGRSFYSNSPGRKIGEVVRCWRDGGFDVSHVCGGDIPGLNGVGAKQGNYGAQAHHNKWYRQFSITKILTHSVSEYRDIKHDSRTFNHIKELALENKPLLIWERSSRLHKAGLDLAKQLNIPYVLEWKDHLIPYNMSFFLKQALAVERYKNLESSYIVVESEVLKEQLVREENLNPSKIYVAINAINPDDFNADTNARSQLRAICDVSDDQVLIGYLGSYAFYHDTKRLITAAHKLSKLLPLKFKVLMVGNGKEYDECRKLAKAFGVLDNYVIMQDGVAKEQVPNILSALDVAVLPGSTDIICPIKVQEYMYMGLPSVIPDYICNREIINSGVDGFLFDTKEDNSIVECLRYLVENAEEREKIGERAKIKAANEFTWEKTWGDTLRKIEADIQV